jgi:hypothetical protein
MRFFLNYIILENIWNLSLIGFMAIYRQPNIQIIFKCKIDLQKKAWDFELGPVSHNCSSSIH